MFICTRRERKITNQIQIISAESALIYIYIYKTIFLVISVIMQYHHVNVHMYINELRRLESRPLRHTNYITQNSLRKTHDDDAWPLRPRGLRNARKIRLRLFCRFAINYHVCWWTRGWLKTMQSVFSVREINLIERETDSSGKSAGLSSIMKNHLWPSSGWSERDRQQEHQQHFSSNVPGLLYTD